MKTEYSVSIDYISRNRTTAWTRRYFHQGDMISASLILVESMNQLRRAGAKIVGYCVKELR